MIESFNYTLNPAYCLYRGVAIENQKGSNISFCVSDKKDCKAVKKGFYEFVDYVRTLSECPPEYNKRTVVKFKRKNRSEIEKMISAQMLKVYTSDQFKILEDVFSDSWGLVVISSSESFQNYNDFLHLKFLQNPNSCFEKDYWSVNGKLRIKQRLEEGKLVFVEMTKSNVADVVSELTYGDVLSEKTVRDFLKCVVIQEGHSFSGGKDLLVDLAVLKRKLPNKRLSDMSDEEKDNAFIHYTNFGEVLRNGMDRLFSNNKVKTGRKAKASIYYLIFGLIFAASNLFICCDSASRKDGCGLLINSDISNGFIKSCLDFEQNDLNRWQKEFRNKWNLSYIGWAKADSFMVDDFVQKDSFPLYYGYWEYENGQSIEKGEVYSRNVASVKYNKKKHNSYECEIVPYEIRGEIDYEVSNVSFDYEFCNKTEKQISSFTIVFYLFDEDGNPPESLRNNIVARETVEVAAYTSVSEKIGLERYFDIVPDEQYTVDFLYVSKIEFTDNTVWSDPFGMKYFN